MSIERLQSHYGFTRMPFGKDLAPGDAARPSRALRGGREDLVVHHRAGDRGDQRRVRRGQDGRRASGGRRA